MKIQDVLVLKRGYDLPESKRINGQYLIYSSNGIAGSHNEYKVKGPAVITGRSGSLGTVQYTENNCWPLNTTLYVSDFKGNNPKYISYLLQMLHLEKYGSGSAVPTLNRNHLDNLEVTFHSLIEQQHIVDIIGSIDDKIENNNKIIEKFNKFLKIKTNELLLYKTTKIQLNDIIEECKEKTDIELTPYSVVNTGKVIIQNEQFNKEIAKNIKGKYKKIKKDFFVYNPSRINIGSIGMMEDKIGCVSPIYIVFKCDVEYKIYLQQLLTFEFMIKEINKRCSGSVRQALPFKDLCSIEIYDIERDKLKLYNKYCENIIKTIKKLEEENLKLQQLKNNYLAKFF